MELSSPDEEMELSGPQTGGWYTSQLADWVPLCPQLKDSAVRLYWIMRALVIEKWDNPVRKLTLPELCHLLPTASGGPSSLARVRSLLSDLSAVGLISTPEGQPVKTSSRAKASGAAHRIQINDRPGGAYAGPRNAFAALDSIRAAAREQTAAAIRQEEKRSAARKAEHTAQSTNSGAGQKSGPHPSAAEPGQKSSPAGQVFSPAGQKSGPDSATDLQDHEPPFSPSVHSSRSHPAASRPSVRIPEVDARASSSTDGRTDGGDVGEDHGAMPGAARDGGPAAAHAAPDTDAATGAGVGPGVPAAAAPLAVTPGVELLTAIGAEFPAFALTGEALADQGLMVTGMLEAGWTTAQVCALVAGTPLPDPITTSVGAVVAWRLRQAARGPAPASVPRIPGPTSGSNGYEHQEHGGRDATPVPASWAEKREQIEAAVAGRGSVRDCAEDSPGGAGCTKLAVPGEDRCAEHLGWPVCPACKRHRVRPGRDVEICETCAADPVRALNLAAELAEQEHYYASGQFARDARGIEREPQAAKAPF